MTINQLASKPAPVYQRTCSLTAVADKVVELTQAQQSLQEKRNRNAKLIPTVAADQRPRETHAATGDAPPRFVDRLPLKLKGAEIYAVSAEDHYLRIHTDRGSDLILMRLADAVGELEGLEGAQTHRSWWVAKSAVVEVKRGNGRATLTLSNGLQAPVSRRFSAELREDGWY